MNSISTKPRYEYLDILRVIASFLVCYNHAYGYHLFLDQEADGSLLSWINVLLSSLVAANIPLFFMISGALLLNKRESYSVLFRKRIFRILVLIIAASAVTYLMIPPECPSIQHFLSQLFSGTVNGSHWYLFAYLSLLLLLPFLRPAAQTISGQDLLLLVILRTVFRPGLSILNFWLAQWGFDPIIFSVHLQFPLSMVDCFFCPIAGYWLAHKLSLESITQKQRWLCMGGLIGSCLLASLMTYAEASVSHFTQNYIGEFGYLSAMALFVLIRYFTEHTVLPQKLTRVFARISSVAIGIFLLEPIVVHYLYLPFFSPIPWHPVIITFFSVVWCVVCMGVGGTITWLLRKIPGVKAFI